MKTKHTPGPWKVNFESVDPEWAVVTTSGGRIIANVNSESGLDTSTMNPAVMPRDANARLIAASPKLLELVKLAYDTFTDNDMQPPNHALAEWLNAARAAFTKIETSTP